ncbi:MAG: hypothetical protein ABW202_15295 [Duganella sp.]
MKYGRIALVAALACAAWLPSAQAQQDKLCVDQACLGMTLEQAASLKLEPASSFGFKFSGNGDFYGLDRAGKRVNYAESGDFDNALINQFRSSVATICSFGGANAKLTGSNGERVVLLFAPAIKQGKGELVLTEIARYLPKKLSEEERQRIQSDARARYGDAFSSTWSQSIKRPDVALYSHPMLGNTLTFRLPEQDVRQQLLAQPGCASNTGGR